MDTQNDSTTDPYTPLGDHSEITTLVTANSIELIDVNGDQIVALTAAESIALADIVLKHRNAFREAAAHEARRHLWHQGNRAGAWLMNEGHDVTQVEVGYSVLRDVGMVATVTTTPDAVIAWAVANDITPTEHDREVGRTRMVTTWARSGDVVATATAYTDLPETAVA